jgi:flagellar basal-body rod protein FlgB
MMKVATNQMDFQTVSTLYSKSLGLLKLAVGKK